MGKKSKKKGAAKKTPNKSAQNIRQSTHDEEAYSTKDDAGLASHYGIYKAATNAVIQWGRATYNKLKKTKKPGNSNVKESLSHIIFEILGSLAEERIPMSETVWQHLKTAIYYRKRVGRFYRSLPDAAEAYLRHEWLIQRLEDLARAFGQNRKAHEENETTNTAANPQPVGVGYDVLATSDDEESVASTADDGDIVDESKEKAGVVLEKLPTPEELELEERQFAIALFLCDLDSIRKSLRERWENWAKQTPRDDVEAAQNLLAITSSTEYTLSAVHKSVLQLSLEIHMPSSLDKLIKVMGKSLPISTELTTADFEEGDLVTIHSLEKRPDLNGCHGYICQPVNKESERLAVRLFPGANHHNKKAELAVQPKNLVLSDETFRRICQIHSAVGSVNLNDSDIPAHPQKIYGASTSRSVQQAGIEMIMNGDKFEAAARNRDFGTLLQLTLKHSLPLWISLSRYLPDAGAADAVFNAYIRNYADKGELKFSLAFALLVAMDGAIVCACNGSGDKAEATKDLFVRVLDEVFTSSPYTPAIRLFENDGKKAGALYSHLELTKHMREEYSVAGMFFPIVSGELMLSGLRMHFVCSSGLPYAYVEKFTHVLHIYWLLRSEGQLGAIPELESIIRMYQQHVFFRGGLAKKGQGAYLKFQQLAQGVSIEAVRHLDGRAGPRNTGRLYNSEALTYEGLHVTEISRLLDVLQWKSMPILNKEACFDEIEQIAREEYSSVFTAPLMAVSVKLYQLASNLERDFSGLARQSGTQMIENFSLHTSGMLPIDLVSFWVMALGDNRSVISGEKITILNRISVLYKRVFEGMVEPIIPGEEPTLTFSSNHHKVDAALWGEKGARKWEHLPI